MIRPNELSSISNREGVRPQQIEKDYIISWLLWGISRNTLLRDAIIFKGGTCLKKIHIADYRFSEDMDFTINPGKEDGTSNADIYAVFDEVFADIKETANIDLSIPEDSKEIHESTNSPKFHIEYVAPLGGRGDHVKIDVTRGEQLEFDVEYRTVQNEYSDLEEEGEFSVYCYGLKEVVIEKMAALMDRTVPRDLYDFEYLTNTEGVQLQDVFYEFERKAEHKGHIPSEFVERVARKEKTFERLWETNLSHHIKQLSKFKDVWRAFNKQARMFEKIK